MSQDKFQWTITHCTVADAPALAHNNMSAFWTDPSWRLLWPKDIELSYLIDQCSLRYPRSLSQNRQTMRHQKAIDPTTGEVVGYARWVLPEGLDQNAAGREGVAWPDAQVPRIPQEEEKEFEKRALSAWWSPRTDMGAMDDQIHAIADRHVRGKVYIELDYLAVHPSRKGQGIATALVRSGLAFADSIGVPVQTIAFHAARGIYDRLGFKEVDRVVQRLDPYGGQGEYTTYFMVREVCGAAI
ncbi:GNAT family N-acetyltransferase [Aspergillus mulundensis]|uniref:N-acetyltransferase domain-containing protein n=1 Tax=Aspergillus mulundensis TaxID=1810919 RepID=A0A3D8QVM0_9EURO|nr:Uncharacterized protein DSM5745_09487 [Aspergillus mulundensis]RDW65748.1 Uncharacterized protein DSM5745_09487 [Aspergillus mulundensis]